MYSIIVYDNVSNLMLYIDNIVIRLSKVYFSQSHSHQKNGTRWNNNEEDIGLCDAGQPATFIDIQEFVQ